MHGLPARNVGRERIPAVRRLAKWSALLRRVCAPVGGRAATVVLAAGLLMGCAEDITPPQGRPPAIAPTLSVAASTDLPHAVQLP